MRRDPRKTRTHCRLAAVAVILLAAGGIRANGPDTGVALWIDLPEAVGDRLVVDVPIDGRAHACELRRTSVRSPGYRLLVQHAGGVVVAHTPGPSRTWRGTIDGIAASVVTASLGEDGLDMTIHLSAEAEPLRVEPVPGLRGAHLLQRGGLALSSNLMCGFAARTPPAGGPAGPLEPAVRGGVAGASGDCSWTAELAFDADHLYFEKFGSVAAVEARLNAVVNTLNPWYERDLEITHSIGTIVVRTSAEDDPYSDTTVIVELLQEFTAHWNSTMQAIPRDLAQLVSDRVFVDPDSGIEPVGNAFFREVCTNGSYSVVRDVGGLSCAAYVSAHELGHNWGSDHCACSADEGTGCPAGVCPPEADCFCPGWIMSASFGCATAFNPDFTIPQITAFRDTRTCIDLVCALPNDDCVDAIVLADGAHPFTNLGASTDGPPEGVCSIAPFGQDVWYTYEASCDGTVLIDVCGSDFDTRLAIYGPDCPGGEDPLLACANDVCGQASLLAIVASEGDRLLIRVGGDGAAQGSGTLTIAGPSCPDCPTDTDGNGATDVDDFVAVILDWGTPGVNNNGDVNGSGGVDVDDLIAVILAWGPC